MNDQKKTHRLNLAAANCVVVACCMAFVLLIGVATCLADHIDDLQTEAIEKGRSDVGHWGIDPEKYTQWGSHSNRLIPVYAFGTKQAGPGIDLSGYTGENSPYRSEEKLANIYGRLPSMSVNSKADYMDQTAIAEIQKAALAAGKKHVFLVIFDGMDWQTTRAAAVQRAQAVRYTEGRGTGLHFQDYQAGGNTQFAWMVTSPVYSKLSVDVNTQQVKYDGQPVSGGYCPELGGFTPWEQAKDVPYLIGQSNNKQAKHTVADSAGTATAMNSGVKTYNGSIGVDVHGMQLKTAAHAAQELGLAVGVISSVPISHATPAATYAHNVNRNDYQDLSRDLLGLPSVSHPDEPLLGVDVLIGGGFGVDTRSGSAQGSNFIAGNRYLADADLAKADVKTGGRYRVAARTSGVDGTLLLRQAAAQAVKEQTRLLGFFGVGKYSGHLPFRTADGDFQPAIGRSKTAEQYSTEDLLENPSLAEMTKAALTVLEKNPRGSWLMVEAGDVDWANHDNNLDNSIGAVFSGDEAVKVITDWVERESNWQESLLIVTADHGHYLNLDRPERLVEPEHRR